MASNNTQVYVPCTLQTCPLSMATIPYQPNLGANATFLVIFALALAVQIWSSIKYRTWTHLVGMTGGLLLEIVGYVGRIMLHYNPFNFNNFVIYLVCLTVAPAFISAVIYICFYRVTIIYGQSLFGLKPRILAIIFICCDIICLILQAAGGAIASLSNGTSREARAQGDMGINIMIAGLVFQVISLLAFLSCAAYYLWSMRRRYSEPKATTVKRGLWYAFLTSLGVAAIAIFVRSVYRVAELREGFQGKLAGNEALFMILEGAMIVITTVALTVFHPGYCLGVPWKVQAAETSMLLESRGSKDGYE
ncbi:Efflux pump himE [Penicillium diatomitis]|uniref:Efflux pump himE n=1 Tax=Penicillium diatomitis TaxID=2819901 RepID=A0A9W9WUP9_9EURO|nr:Efflux pump himE [Penicillium diatomitis]KAJ5477012.1 Efflux pump himE [Penicillium diatomitis]